MKSFLFLCIIFLGLSNLSARSTPHYAGLLTNDFGILTLDDFHEDGQLNLQSHFPQDNFENYWQCLEPEEYFLNCENTGPMEPGEDDIGAATFWIRSEGKVYDFGTRRNWDIGFCEDMISSIKKIIKDEPAICVYASYLDSTTKSSRWIIDRVKTTKGEWSWFGNADEISDPQDFTGEWQN